MSQTTSSTIQASGADRLVDALLVAPVVCAALAALVFSRQPQLSVSWRAGYVTLGTMAFVAAALFFWRLRRPRPRLRVTVCQGSISFHQRGRRSASFPRAAIEMVVIEEGPVGQTCSLSVYGPLREELGTWPTGWITKPTMKVIRTLQDHGYPHAFRHPRARLPNPAEADRSPHERRRGVGPPAPVSSGSVISAGQGQ
jgi:hypothetical protein